MRFDRYWVCLWFIIFFKARSFGFLAVMRPIGEGIMANQQDDVFIHYHDLDGRKLQNGLTPFMPSSKTRGRKELTI